MHQSKTLRPDTFQAQQDNEDRNPRRRLHPLIGLLSRVVRSTVNGRFHGTRQAHELTDHVLRDIGIEPAAHAVSSYSRYAS